MPVMMTSSRTRSSLAAQPTILPTNRLLGQRRGRCAGDRGLDVWPAERAERVSDLTIGSIVDACLRARPTGTAATLGSKQWTFADLDAAANSCAYALRARGGGGATWSPGGPTPRCRR